MRIARQAGALFPPNNDNDLGSIPVNDSQEPIASRDQGMDMFAFRTLTGFVCVLALAACGGGGGGGGGGSNGTSISISPTSVTITANEGAAAPAPTNIHVNFVGDGVLIGYPPGVPEPTWLTVTSSGNTTTTAEVSLSVSGTSVPGTYSTTLRFVTGREDGTGIRSVDLPISYTVVASDLAISTSVSTLSFAALAPGPAPAAQTLTVTYNGDDVSISDAPPWLTATRTNPGVSPASFSIAPNSTNFDTGSTINTHITFVTSRAGNPLQRQRTVGISYLVAGPFSASAPTMSFDSIAGMAQLQPASGYTMSILGEMAQWRITGLPAWLHASATSGTGVANVQFTADSTGLGFGTQSSQITVTDDSSGATQTFQAIISHRAARLVVQPTSFQFSIDSSTTAPALSQSFAISDELGGTQAGNAVSWSLQSVSAPWVKISPTSGSSVPGGQVTVSLDEDALGDVLGGDHSATITLTFQNAQAANQTLTLPVTLHDHVARVEFVAPYIGLANVAGRLIVRGTDFNTAGPLVAVNVGSTQIGAISPDSDTQLTINYPALAAGRYPVSIQNQLGITSTVGELVVHTPPAFAYQAIAAPASRSRIVYDAERLALYAVDGLGQQLEQYEYAMGTWSAVPSTVIPDLTDIALTPDGRRLTVLTRDNIRDIDLNSSPLTAVSRVSNPDPFGGAYFANLAMANNGKAFIARDISGSGFVPSYLFDVRDYSLTQNPYFDGWLYRGIVGGSADGAFLYAGSNGVSPEPEVKIFTAATNTIANSTYHTNLTGVTVSGNASRVVLQDISRINVYDQGLTNLLGHLDFVGVPLVSRDSSKVFVYRDDGAQPRIVVYDLNGDLVPGGLYPISQTIDLADSPSDTAGNYYFTKMATTPDDKTLFVSGTQRILVVPVP